MTAQTPLTQEMIDSHLAHVLRHGDPRDVFFYLRFVKNPNIPMVNMRFATELLPIWAAMSGDYMHVNMAALLKLHPNVNVYNNKGQNPAMKAFENKHAGLGLMLLKAGTDLSARDKNGVGLLKYIIDAGYPDALQEAIKLGLDINQTVLEENKDKNAQGGQRFLSGALAWAIANENWDILHVLIDAGIDRSSENPAVRQAMKTAESFAHINPSLRSKLGAQKYKQALERAAKKSADFMRVITDGVFPQAYTFEGLCKDEETFQKRLVLLPPEVQEEVLVKTGIVRASYIGLSDDKRRQMFAPLTIDEKLIYPSHTSIQQILDRVLLEEIKYGEAKNVYMWLKLGANPNAVEEKGGKPALFAAVEENLMETKMAQKKEALIRSAKFNKTTPKGIDNLADEFMEFKDSPYQKTKYLLEFGADPNTVHKLQKMSVLERAYGKGRLGIVQLLKKQGVQSVEGLLVYTAQYGEAQGVEDLFKEYTITNAHGQKETKTLLSAEQIQKESLEALKIAIERGKPRMVHVMKEHGLVPPADSQEGKALWEMARRADNSMVLSALEGQYFIPSELQKPLTLNEKIAELSAADLRRLIGMTGAHETMQPTELKKAAVPGDKIGGQTSIQTAAFEQADKARGKSAASVKTQGSQKPLSSIPSKKQRAVKRAFDVLRRFGRNN